MTEPNPTPASSIWRRRIARASSTMFTVSIAPLVLIGLSGTVGLFELLPTSVHVAVALLAWPLAAAFILGLLGMLVARLTSRSTAADPVALHSPVRGRWRAMNSPASRVPSHGTHQYGQTHAIDLVHEPRPGARPAFGGWHPMRHPEEYPAFGQPLHAPLAGRVVTVRDRGRDHRCRSNLVGYAYMLVEGMVIGLRGPVGVMGNHLVIESIVDGELLWVTLAHLRRGSATVAIGDELRAGQVVAQIGNSGNSSEPHVHLQVTDHPRPREALGRPFVFTDVVVSDTPEPPPDARPSPLVPVNDAIFHAGVEDVPADTHQRPHDPG